LAERKDKMDGSFQTFLAKHLNVQIGLNLRAGRWPGVDFWETTKIERGMDLERLIATCDVLTVGIDGGGLDDLLGFAVLGRDSDTREWRLWVRAWAHRSVLERRKSEAPRLQGFASDGDLVIVDRVGDDVEQVADIVEQCEASGLLDTVGCDPAGIGAILDALEEAGLPHEKIVSVGQGWRLNASIKTLERKLAGGELVHAGQPLMAWSVGNARQEPRGNAVIITKQASGTAKIDPVMATLNAVHLMSLNPASQGKSFWDRE
jgi:phage terminase large subunit-like protein